MRKMIDSGYQWIGNIPEGWTSNPIRNVIIQRDGGAWGSEVQDDATGTICMRVADFDYEKGLFCDADDENLTYRHYSSSQIYKLKLKPGDILVEKSGGGEKTPVGRTVLFDKEYTALFANFMDRIRVDQNKVTALFVEYWLRSLYACRVTPYYIKQTTGIQNLDLSLMMAKERIVYPSINEQISITNFLDEKCAVIDKVLFELNSQIETLEQYKRSIITEVATKGLESNVKMKASGAGWMPLIPQHWNVDKAKYHLRFSDLRDTGDCEVLSLYRELGVIPKDSRDDNHNVTSEDTSKYRFVNVGDFVINKMKAWQGSVAVSDYSGIVSPAYYVYKFTDDVFNKRYFHYLLRNRTYATEFRRLSGGIRDGQWDLPRSAFENTLILIPPMEEQNAIAAYLDNKCERIENVIAQKNEQLTTLKNYKDSLIYEYITGKKEVSVA